jgi:hypothetical protein
MVDIVRLYSQSIELYRFSYRWSAGRSGSEALRSFTANNSTNIHPISMYLGLIDRATGGASDHGRYSQVI